jgi:hypothetical protein
MTGMSVEPFRILWGYEQVIHCQDVRGCITYMVEMINVYMMTR